MSLKDIFEWVTNLLAQVWYWIISVDIIPVLIIVGLYFFGVFIYGIIIARKEDMESRHDG